MRLAFPSQLLTMASHMIWVERDSGDLAAPLALGGRSHPPRAKADDELFRAPPTLRELAAEATNDTEGDDTGVITIGMQNTSRQSPVSRTGV